MHRSAGLTMRKLCGELECPKYHLCQLHDLQCYPCPSYCNETSNNFDANICEQRCQDYIHDYIQRYVKADEIQDSLQDLEFLKFWMTCLTVLIVIAFILIFIAWMILWNRKRETLNVENGRKKSGFKNKMVSLKFKDNAVSIISETMDNPLTETTMRSTVSSSFNSQASTTNSSPNKLPCEDFTLEAQDFIGYDNSGMWKMSPVRSKLPFPCCQVLKFSLLVGIIDVGDSVWQLMIKMFSDEVLSLYSLLGYKKNKKISKLECCNVLDEYKMNCFNKKELTAVPEPWFRNGFSALPWNGGRRAKGATITAIVDDIEM
ncbi:protein grindelwald-like [Rhopalosiphum maidis]|uniref:protein grindelwald-like n=1 Tax=Rhopalosiphum maidis TaxID=43146 RepID=UPI000F00FE1B|nr:protein grindelwald-like [Rhopalosiphum maidis]